MASTKTSTYSPLETNPVEAEAQAVEVVGLASVQVKAPSDLPGGYHLCVEVNGKKTLVAIPEGGVEAGVSFNATLVHEDDATGGHHIPVGSWRDGILDCCMHGCFHPSLCMAIWCNMCLLGQVMTRMNLDWIGSPVGNRAGTWSPFKIMVAATVAFYSLYFGTFFLIDAFTPETPEGDDSPARGWSVGLLSLRGVFIPALLLYVFVAKIRTRAYIRRKYGVRPNVCSGCGCCGCGSCCDDFWASYMCSCLVTAQMDRHTADYDKNGGDCCSATGLPHCSPTIV